MQIETKKLAPYWYTPVGGRGLELKLSPLTSLQAIEAQQGAKIDDAGVMRLATKGVEHILRCAVLDWKGAEDDEGRPLEFSLDVLFNVPWPVLLETATHLVGASILSADEKKASRLLLESANTGTDSTATPANGGDTAT